MDTVTIYRLADAIEGSSAIVGFLTNNNITFPAYENGTIISLSEGYENGHGEFWVYEGLNKITTGIRFDVVSEKRCTVAFLSSPAPVGTYKITTYEKTD